MPGSCRQRLAGRQADVANLCLNNGAPQRYSTVRFRGPLGKRGLTIGARGNSIAIRSITYLRLIYESGSHVWKTAKFFGSDQFSEPGFRSREKYRQRKSPDVRSGLRVTSTRASPSANWRLQTSSGLL